MVCFLLTLSRRGGGGDAADCVSGGAGGYHRRAGFDHGSDAKFDDYEQSLVTLFQCFTTEHWRFVLNDTLTLDTENSLHLRAIFIIAFLFMSQVALNPYTWPIFIIAFLFMTMVGIDSSTHGVANHTP